MTTKNEMLKARDAAGARYLTAVKELRSAYIDLVAYDVALSNRHHGAGDMVRTFNGKQEQEGVPDGLLHPDYCTRGDIEGAWHRQAEAKAAEHLAALQNNDAGGRLIPRPAIR